MELEEALAHVLTCEKPNQEVARPIAALMQRYQLSSEDAQSLRAIPPTTLVRTAQGLVSKRWERLCALMPATTSLLTAIDTETRATLRASVLLATARTASSPRGSSWRIREADVVATWLAAKSGQAPDGVAGPLAELASYESLLVEQQECHGSDQAGGSERLRRNDHAEALNMVRVGQARAARCVTCRYDVARLRSHPQLDVCRTLPPAEHHMLVIADARRRHPRVYRVSQFVAAVFGLCHDHHTGAEVAAHFAAHPCQGGGEADALSALASLAALGAIQAETPRS